MHKLLICCCSILITTMAFDLNKAATQAAKAISDKTCVSLCTSKDYWSEGNCTTVCTNLQKFQGSDKAKDYKNQLNSAMKEYEIHKQRKRILETGIIVFIVFITILGLATLLSCSYAKLFIDKKEDQFHR